MALDDPAHRLPRSNRVVVVHADGCAPIVKAFVDGRPESEPWPDPRTFAAGIRVPKALGDFIVLKALRQSGGTAVAVSETEIAESMRSPGEAEGMLVCPEGGAAIAGTAKLRRDGGWGRTKRASYSTTQRSQVRRFLPGEEPTASGPNEIPEDNARRPPPYHAGVSRAVSSVAPPSSSTVGFQCRRGPFVSLGSRSRRLGRGRGPSTGDRCVLIGFGLASSARLSVSRPPRAGRVPLTMRRARRSFPSGPHRRAPLIFAGVLMVVALADLVLQIALVPIALQPYFVPVILIVVGLYLLVEPRGT